METNKQTVVKSGTLKSKRTKKVGLSSKNIASIMSILTNIYSDAYEATLREYWANALDSHRQAGQTRPVEVTLPTVLSPSLLIQDFGIGMTVDTVFDVFAEYGESTKNDEGDEAVGGFGIGAKSAFTMGSQFIVTAVKDGHKCTVLFSMGSDGVPDTDLMGESETDEPDGVLISLAVEDIDRMRRTARKVFSVSDPALTLVDGEHPESALTNAFEVNESVSLVKEHEGLVYALLGPVAYPVSKSQFQQVAKVLGEDPAAEVALVLANWDSDEETSVFFKAGVNDMDIAPSRESLRDTRKTINALAALVTGLHQDLTDSVQARLDNCSSAYAAAREFNAAQADIAPLKVSRKAVHFQGLEGFKTEVELTGLVKYSLGTNGYNWRTGRTSSVIRVQEFKDFAFDVKTADKVLVVTEVPEGEEGTVKRYAKRFIENTEGVEHIVVTPAQGATYGGWFTFGVGVTDGAKCMTRTEFRAALKEMRGNIERTSNEPSYTVGVGQTASRDLNDRDLLSDILSWGKDIVVFEGYSPSGALAAEVLADYTPLVLLGTQSEAALLKRIEADGSCEVVEIDVDAEVRRIATERLAQVSDAERAALGAVTWLETNVNQRFGTEYLTWKAWANEFEKRAFGTFPEFQEIQEWVEAAQLVAEDITEDRRSELADLARAAGSSNVEGMTFDYEIPRFAEFYPMLSHVGVSPLQDSRWNDQDAKRSEVRADVLAYFISKHF